MSSNTKQILAITLGSLGLLLGILGTLTAFNVKQSVRSDSEITAEVKSDFAAAQARQDADEKKQESDAEKFVASLDNKEKSLLKTIGHNAAKLKRNSSSVRNLRAQVQSLSSRNRQVSSELASVEVTQSNQHSRLNKRINKTNAGLNQLHRNVQNLRNTVNLLANNP